MYRCTCTSCRKKRSGYGEVVAVELGLEITRPGWESPNVWGEVTTEHVLRAEVTFHSRSDDPEVSWLDQGVVEDLQLTDKEERAAELQAVDTALDKLSKRDQENVELNAAIDAETARWKEEREMARSA